LRRCLAGLESVGRLNGLSDRRFVAALADRERRQ
jgi:hypothetical protein